MYLMETQVVHQQETWRVDFFSDAGDQVTVRLAENAAVDVEDAIERARQIMVQMTPFGTRGGEPSLNRYDSLSNGNFDEDPGPSGTKH